MSDSFALLGVPEALVDVLARRGITEPFPIQAATIPSSLEGRDICGKAPTGSGKTLAFGLPVVCNIEQATKRRPKALVLSPTRELAEQIKDELSPLARAGGRSIHAIYGGTSYGPQRKALDRGVDILVATPGRLEDLIDQKLVNLSEVSVAVVDEADRMADMGFLRAVQRILDLTKSRQQTLLFSATLDGDVGVLVDRYQSDPIRFETASSEEDVEVQHHFWMVDHQDRVGHTADVVATMGRSIVFTRTRHGADRLAKQLDRAGVKAVAMHGGRSQNQRNRALDAFSKGKAQALVATDVAARGIHIDSVEAVVHYDPAGDEKDFIHRSGRTGRAGAQGTVVTLVTTQHRKSVKRMQRSLSINEPIRKPEPLIATKRVEKPATRRDAKPNARPEVSGPSESLFVGNLPWSTTADDLDRIFSRKGRVINTEVATKRGRSKGYGFVEMEAGSAGRAIAELNHSKLEGRRLKVRAARP